MASISSLQEALTEIATILGNTQSDRIKKVLNFEAEKIKSEIEALAAFAAKASAAPTVKSACPVSKISKYGWDETDKFVNVYITLKGIQNLPTANIVTSFKTKSFSLQVCDLDSKSYDLTIHSLLGNIDPSKSKFRAKTDMLVLNLKKEGTEKWVHLTEADKKVKEAKEKKLAPSVNKADKDPQEGLMSLMKDLYDNGDDEMKRTIAKAWTQSQDKKSSP